MLQIKKETANIWECKVGNNANIANFVLLCSIVCPSVYPNRLSRAGSAEMKEYSLLISLTMINRMLSATRKS